RLFGVRAARASLRRVEALSRRLARRLRLLGGSPRRRLWDEWAAARDLRLAPEMVRPAVPGDVAGLLPAVQPARPPWLPRGRPVERRGDAILPGLAPVRDPRDRAGTDREPTSARAGVSARGVRRLDDGGCDAALSGDAEVTWEQLLRNDSGPVSLVLNWAEWWCLEPRSPAGRRRSAASDERSEANGRIEHPPSGRGGRPWTPAIPAMRSM